VPEIDLHTGSETILLDTEIETRETNVLQSEKISRKRKFENPNTDFASISRNLNDTRKHGNIHAYI